MNENYEASASTVVVNFSESERFTITPQFEYDTGELKVEFGVPDDPVHYMSENKLKSAERNKSDLIMRFDNKDILSQLIHTLEILKDLMGQGSESENVNNEISDSGNCEFICALSKNHSCCYECDFYDVCRHKDHACQQLYIDRSTYRTCEFYDGKR